MYLSMQQKIDTSLTSINLIDLGKYYLPVFARYSMQFYQIYYRCIFQATVLRCSSRPFQNHFCTLRLQFLLQAR